MIFVLLLIFSVVNQSKFLYDHLSRRTVNLDGVMLALLN